MAGLNAGKKRVTSWLSRLDGKARRVTRNWPDLPFSSSQGDLLLLALGYFAAILPIFFVRDLPFIDVPTHLAAVHAWSHFDDPSWGYQSHYELHISAVPYWGYYGFLRYTSVILPLRWANDLYVMLSFAGIFWGLAALLKAHGRPRIMALAAVPLLWNYPLWYGFLAYVGGMALLFPACLLLLRLSREENATKRAKLALANSLMGVLILFFHPLALLLWLVAVGAYLWNRYFAVVAPSLLAFVIMGSGATSSKNHIIKIQGLWRTPDETLRRFVADYVFAFIPITWNGVVLGVLGLSAATAFLLIKRSASPQSDRRPWHLFGLLTLAFLALPLHLQKPLGFAVVNPRVAVVLILAAILCVPQGQLQGWRKMAVVLPLCITIAILSASLCRRFHSFDRRGEDFYTCVAPLPRNPRVLTLIYDASDSDVRGNVWRKFASYVMVEKGGYNPLLWDSSQGIGRLKFPLGYAGPRPSAPAADDPRSFRWAKHAASYDYFLTRHEPAQLFASRNELVLRASAGAWKLWARASLPEHPKKTWQGK